jgi:hypothetical protein
MPKTNPQHEPWVLAVTAIINLLVKIAKESQCDLPALGAQIKSELVALQPPFSDSAAQVVLEKFLERIENADQSHWSH